MRKILPTIWVCLAAFAAAAVLVIDVWLIALDRCSAALFGKRVRSAIPWSRSIVIAPVLPLYSLTHSQLVEAGLSAPVASLAWLAVGVALAEIYAVLLRRESWICAYEPHWISVDATPLGYQPRRFEDRRLHRLLYIQVCFGIPVAIAAALTPVHLANAAQCAVAGYFLLKYFSYSGPDFEAVVHWSMHTRSFAGVVKTSREWIAHILMEYVCGPINGYVPHVYESNHLMVHHVYHGHVGDIHSPAAFDRLSFVEFSVFAWRFTLDTLFCVDLIRHKNCRGRRRRRLLVSLVAFWTLLLILSWFGSLLSYLLVFALVHHGITTARSQIIWHGLIEPSNSRGPESSTVNWATPEETKGKPDTYWCNEIVRLDSGANPAAERDLVPDWKHHWAFFDNLHLLHHQHPATHFRDYPKRFLRAIAGDQHGHPIALTLNLQFMATHCMALWRRDVKGVANSVLGMPADEASNLVWERTRPIGPTPSLIKSLRGTDRLVQLDKFFCRVLEKLMAPIRPAT